MAAAIVRNRPELADDRDAQAELAKCKVAIVGLSDDTGVVMNHGRPGARGGPAAFRAALARYGVASPVEPEGEIGPAKAYPHVFDAGDIIIGNDLNETHDRITETVLALLERGLMPIGIGGGHDLTFPFVRGTAKAHGSLTGAYLDAHLDVRPEIGSGMPFRALLEGGFIHEPLVVGLNPLVNTREHAEYFRKRGGRVVTADEVAWSRPYELGRHLAEATERGAAFLSLDLDVIDSAYAPGVSAVNPCGLSPRQVEAIVHRAGRSRGVVAFDIMELNPAMDQDGRTARLAAHMFLTFLRGLAERELGD